MRTRSGPSRCVRQRRGRSFWGRMRTELLNTRKWRTRIELSTKIFDWIEVFYNRTRRHSSLGMLAPVAYEKLYAHNTSAA
ncbi:MAG: integrase core domain-containing protein [Actinobacteria bacterium]|nr:integrase core domain-containing protein [Actinomycetota bacterium]